MNTHKPIKLSLMLILMLLIGFALTNVVDQSSQQADRDDTEDEEQDQNGDGEESEDAQEEEEEEENQEDDSNVNDYAEDQEEEEDEENDQIIDWKENDGYDSGDGIQILPQNPCSLILCTQDTQCVDGKCLARQRYCQIDQDCAIPEICLKGKCFNRCRTTKCPGGSICVHRNCIPQNKFCRKNNDCGRSARCIDNECQRCPGGRCRNCGKWQNCPKGTKCQNNRCVPILNVCPRNARYNAKVCSDPRPTEKECPGKVYVQSPGYSFCGVDSEGQKNNFIRQCEACKDKKIVYYFDEPCHKVPFLCGQNQDCNDYYCSLNGCQVDADCPYDWQTCQQDRCQDRCNLMDCRRSCRFGECDYEEPYGSCSVLRGQRCKKPQWTCIGRQCIQRCVRTPCPPFKKCEAGYCVDQDDQGSTAQ